MDSVKVALRIRPLVNSEIEIGCRPCIERIPNEPQVTIGKGCQMFTFNYVFDENEGQIKVYDEAVKSLIDNLFKGKLSLIIMIFPCISFKYNSYMIFI